MIMFILLNIQQPLLDREDITWSRQECGSKVILDAINSQKVLDVLDKSITLAIHARGSITYH